jgi:hypothetical protein
VPDLSSTANATGVATILPSNVGAAAPERVEPAEGEQLLLSAHSLSLTEGTPPPASMGRSEDAIPNANRRFRYHDVSSFTLSRSLITPLNASPASRAATRATRCHATAADVQRDECRVDENRIDDDLRAGRHELGDIRVDSRFEPRRAYRSGGRRADLRRAVSS